MEGENIQKLREIRDEINEILASLNSEDSINKKETKTDVSNLDEEAEWKLKLLRRNVWEVKEVKKYFSLTTGRWNALQKKLPKSERPPFTNSVYRDDLFKILQTSVEEEIASIKGTL